jgi:hypothetical protein
MRQSRRKRDEPQLCVTGKSITEASHVALRLPGPGPAIAVRELLRRPLRRPVKLGSMLDQAEVRSELIMKRLGSVPNDVQSTALRRTFGTERGNDDMPARLHGTRDLPHVRSAVVRLGEKVEDRPVVPHIELVALEGVG